MKVHNKDSERGASLVEFAFVAPMFFFLIFALIEASALLFARNTIGLAAADASRSGSIDSFASGADDDIIEIIDDRANQSFGAKVNRVVIYKAKDDDSEPSNNCKNGVSGADCVVYDAVDFASPSCTGWCPANREPNDILGIWIEAEYEGLTGLNPFDITWTERRFALIEPKV